MAEQIDWREKQPPQVAYVRLARSEVLRISRHYPRAQKPRTPRHQRDIYQKQSGRPSTLKGREMAIINQTDNGTGSKVTRYTFLEGNVGALNMGFLELN